MQTANLFTYLVISAFAMLLLVTGGVVYLTLSDWRDRRRRDQEKQASRR